jgi:hypothetical protein
MLLINTSNAVICELSGGFVFECSDEGVALEPMTFRLARTHRRPFESDWSLLSTQKEAQLSHKGVRQTKYKGVR